MTTSKRKLIDFLDVGWDCDMFQLFTVVERLFSDGGDVVGNGDNLHMFTDIIPIIRFNILRMSSVIELGIIIVHVLTHTGSVITINSKFMTPPCGESALDITVQ